jgi:hypothetical protein
VIAKALDLSSTGHRTIAEQLNLLLAIVVAISAWIGYHNSRNRAKYIIVFFNFPLLQFAIEIALVYVYWLLVVSSTDASQGSSNNTGTTVLPEAGLIALYFALSCCWDLTAWAMRKAPKYPDMRMEEDRPRRRLVTRVFLLIFVVLTLIIWLSQPAGVAGIVLTIMMTVMVVMHRWAQNAVQQPAAAEKVHSENDGGAKEVTTRRIGREEE